MKTLCKMCKKPMFITPGEDSNPVWNVKLLAMVTCNPCYDFRLERERLTDEIFSNTSFWNAIRESRNAEKVARLRQGVRARLEKLIAAYANHIAGFVGGRLQNLCVTIPVDLLMQEPEKTGQVLSQVRNLVRSAIKGAIPASTVATDGAFAPPSATLTPLNS